MLLYVFFGFLYCGIAYSRCGKKRCCAFGFLASLIVGSMHGINILQTCMLPRSIGNTEQLGFISGIFNGCVYIGSALSTYGFARISEIFGWNGTILVWCICSAAGGIICLCLCKNRRYGKM